MNKYSFKVDNVQKAMRYLAKIEEKVRIESIRSTNLGIFQIYLWMKACISINIILNPLNFISNEYVNSNFSHEEIKQIEKMYQ